MRGDVDEEEVEEVVDRGGGVGDFDERIVGRGGEEDTTEEATTTKVARGPTVPSRWERERHEVSHVPFRAWCATCVAGRGVKSPHKTRRRDGNDLPRFSMDYGFLGSEDRPTSVLLVMKEVLSGMTLGMIVPSKGIAEEWVPRRVAQFINSFNYDKMIIRTDNEPAILALRRSIMTMCTGRVLQEDAIKGESQSNGLAEVGVRIVEGIARTLKIDVEEKMQMKIDDSSVVLAWMIEHACTLYNRCTILDDGRTPWQRAFGKASSLPLVPFLEKVLYKNLKSTGDKKNSLDPRFKYGIYVGSRPRSGEHYVATAGGVLRCRDVRRLSLEKRFDVDLVKKIRGTPWAPLGDDTMLDVPTKIIVDKPTTHDDADHEYRPDKMKRMMIRKIDVEKYGATPKCPGCRASIEGRRQNHTEECRVRLEEEMRKTADGAERIERNNRRLDEDIARDIEKRMRFEEEKRSGLIKSKSGSLPAGAPSLPVAPSSGAAAAVSGYAAPPPSDDVTMKEDEGDDDDDGGVKKKRRVQVLTPEEEMNLILQVYNEPPRVWTTKYIDEITGEPLDEEDVKKGEEEEMEFIRKSNLYTKVRRSDVGGGQRVIPVRWIRVNKGTQERPNVRCRLVAKEIKTYSDDSLFAATPPLEALKILITLAASKRWRLAHVDVRRAYFNAKVLRDVYVELDEKDKEGDDDDMVGKLNFAMYGTRDAASSWEACYTKVLVDGGFAQGAFSPCVFRRGEAVVTVHGDDFTMTGPDDDIDYTKKLLEKAFEIKVQQLCPDDVGGELIVLNRRVTATTTGFAFEPDGKHCLKVLEALGLNAAGTKASTVTGTKTKVEEEELRDRKLDEEAARKYRSVAATLNYLAQDRPDLGFAVKELCRSMSSPSELDQMKMKKLGRYLIGVGNTSIEAPWFCSLSRVEGFSDSDFAGSKDRTSTSGGVIVFGSMVIRSWSKQQKVIALSSGEAELYAAVKLGTELMGIKSLAQDFGLSVELNMHLDASATMGMLARRGAGTMKLVETNQFWLQQVVHSKTVTLHKVATDCNLADLLTKYLGGDKTHYLLDLMKITILSKSVMHRQ